MVLFASLSALLAGCSDKPTGGAAEFESLEHWEDTQADLCPTIAQEPANTWGRSHPAFTDASPTLASIITQVMDDEVLSQASDEKLFTWETRDGRATLLRQEGRNVLWSYDSHNESRLDWGNDWHERWDEAYLRLGDVPTATTWRSTGAVATRIAQWELQNRSVELALGTVSQTATRTFVNLANPGQAGSSPAWHDTDHAWRVAAYALLCTTPDATVTEAALWESRDRATLPVLDQADGQRVYDFAFVLEGGHRWHVLVDAQYGTVADAFEAAH